METISHNDTKQLDLINANRTPRAGGETRSIGRDQFVEETRLRPAEGGKTDENLQSVKDESSSPWIMWTSIHLTRAFGVVFQKSALPDAWLYFASASP